MMQKSTADEIDTVWQTRHTTTKTNTDKYTGDNNKTKTIFKRNSNAKEKKSFEIFK